MGIKYSYLNILKKLIGGFFNTPPNSKEIDDLVKIIWMTEQLKLELNLNEIASICFENEDESYLKYMTEIYFEIKCKCYHKNILLDFYYADPELGFDLLTLKEIQKNTKTLNKIMCNFYKNPIPSEIMLIESAQKILSAIMNDENLSHLISLIETIETIEATGYNIDYKKIWNNCRLNCQRYEEEYFHCMIKQLNDICKNLNKNLKEI